jgi:aryl-alcohol dehydrogenase-like predicted oxidoreductase
VGLGTRGWGTLTRGADAAAQLVAFVEAGGTLVDTSPAYGGGAAQRILAELLDDVVPRRAVVLSGAAGVRAHEAGLETVDTSSRALLGQLECTLREFGTDHLDIWNVGAWDAHTPVDEVARTLEHAVSSGKARYAGARGIAGWQLAALAASTRIAAGQVPYSVLDRGAESDFVPAAQHFGIGVFAAAPLSGGILTGKYRAGVPADSRGANETHAAEIRAALDERAGRVADAIATAADGLATSPLSVALAWVRDRPGVASAVVGARDAAQLTGVLAAEAIELPQAIDDALDDISA